jgi:orotidine-5'-phosphate decarboxylase
VGLDPDPQRIPEILKNDPDPILSFNRAIIEATRDLCVAYKPNTAFYESAGSKGWKTLEDTCALLPDTHFRIADAKRGDIGNTSKRYAEAFFGQMDFDAITVAPYMGIDSVSPFLEFEGKTVILLGLTSNKGSGDFQRLDAEGQPLFEQVIRKAQDWSDANQMMFVIGATHPQDFNHIRSLAPDHFFLVPGVGAQGGDLQAVAQHGMNNRCGLLVNSSRGILYASDGSDFAEAARAEAEKLQLQMAELLGKTELAIP